MQEAAFWLGFLFLHSSFSSSTPATTEQHLQYHRLHPSKGQNGKGTIMEPLRFSLFLLHAKLRRLAEPHPACALSHSTGQFPRAIKCLGGIPRPHKKPDSSKQQTQQRDLCGFVANGLLLPVCFVMGRFSFDRPFLPPFFPVTISQGVLLGGGMPEKARVTRVALRGTRRRGDAKSSPWIAEKALTRAHLTPAVRSYDPIGTQKTALAPEYAPPLEFCLGPTQTPAAPLPFGFMEAPGRPFSA